MHMAVHAQSNGINNAAASLHLLARCPDDGASALEVGLEVVDEAAANYARLPALPVGHAEDCLKLHAGRVQRWGTQEFRQAEATSSGRRETSLADGRKDVKGSSGSTVQLQFYGIPPRDMHRRCRRCSHLAALRNQLCDTLLGKRGIELAQDAEVTQGDIVAGALEVAHVAMHQEGEVELVLIHCQARTLENTHCGMGGRAE